MPLLITQNKFSIGEVSMDIAVPQPTGQDTALSVEQCTCPEGYSGTSCEVIDYFS